MSLPKNVTQFKGTAGRPERDVVIGLDFGTSCTKVVLQDPPLRTSFAVPFGDKGHTGNVYLLPSRLQLYASGRCQLAGFSERGILGLKQRVMVNPEKPLTIGSSPQIRTDPSELASTYIGLVLQYARGWFLDRYSDEFGRNWIRWQPK